NSPSACFAKDSSLGNQHSIVVLDAASIECGKCPANNNRVSVLQRGSFNRTKSAPARIPGGNNISVPVVKRRTGLGNRARRGKISANERISERVKGYAFYSAVDDAHIAIKDPIAAPVCLQPCKAH